MQRTAAARERGLTAMDDEANDAYRAEFDRLFAAIGGPDGWIELPALKLAKKRFIIR
jgi:hypothetical protein